MKTEKKRSPSPYRKHTTSKRSAKTPLKKSKRRRPTPSLARWRERMEKEREMRLSPKYKLWISYARLFPLAMREMIAKSDLNEIGEAEMAASIHNVTMAAAQRFEATHQDLLGDNDPDDTH